MQNRIQVKISDGTYIFAVILLFVVPIRWLLAILLAITVHELSHFLAVRVLGGKVYLVIIDVYGIKMVADSLSDTKKVFAILSGPIIGFLPTFIGALFPELALCCWMLTVYNLLPFSGLDGGNILRIITKNDSIIRWVERIMILIFLFFAIYCSFILRLGVLPCAMVACLYLRCVKKPCQESFCKVQ